MKLIRLFLLLLFFLIVGSVFYLGYLGFIPIISGFMGANKAKDLGVKYTKANFDSYVEKGKTKIVMVSQGTDPAKSVKYSGQTSVNDSFSQEDISARLNYSNWKYMPASNTQVRVNSDGSVEFSANVLMERLPGFVAFTGLGKYSLDDFNKGLKYINLAKVSPPVYLKFKAGAVNNKVNLNLQSARIGKFNLPLEKFDADAALTQIVENVFDKVDGFYAKTVSFSNGQMKFEGTVPEKQEVESN
ncbi:hypothetical protein A2774_05290 [Candidatus Roizmanbacteria bacterium RIFCSPHIGHO2_01_FULL_39_12c]|uniref:Uncharacterized protein n=1 Tax=Candidatus Roizmanbacteria bacterium RIFCSPHIGHO2_01_FULL_39_12c TaxID=1802031 RepID=A0A1F7GBR6_9BACT|nr:MAG: hypothetical protein A2774_05290 [Candidatus Roizmanbacteria bacterium RIFCSPHIGHO2_01_FULL_39_12c]OGK47893.1 MAG: hypothetical protein A2963_03520 [Candidatus Roizmanbacteria bacterium RIFCSPLOWO2_01_FULL_40_13]